MTPQKYLKPTKLGPLVQYLEASGGVEVDTIEEQKLFWSSRKKPDPCDLVYSLARSDLAVAVVRSAEERGLKCYNSSRSMLIARHHYWWSILLTEAGILVPSFALDQEKRIVPDFVPTAGSLVMPSDFSKSYKHENEILHLRVRSFRRSIAPDGEYKVWAYGTDNIRIFRKVQPQSGVKKMEEESDNSDLAKIALGVLEATGLTIASMKFFRQDRYYYLTDICCHPTFNSIPGGVEDFGNWLVREAGGDA
ncbi:MAG: hypothetical protein ACTSU5_08510 [Promethearchaeota archaeon]